MTSTIRKVALAGATGNLGPSILDQLLKAGFEVTVLTRQGSTHKFPDNVHVERVDYDSLESVTEALKGQDAFISTLADVALSKQLLLVQAAADAGVKRFLPSEFGSDASHPKTSQLPIYKDKLAVHSALEKEAAAGRLTYTLVITGAFFDWGLSVGWIADARNRSITMYDGGERMFSTTTLSDVGRAVAGVLKHPDETKNRAVYVHSAALTLKRLSELGQQATGTAWDENMVSIDEQLAQAWAEFNSGSSDPSAFDIKFINTSVWGEGYAGYFKTVDNELLGIEELTDADIQALIKSTL
ncbi:hypothetical protein BJ166DRAFT_620285 [Pestalotiopsis sp. NC0098]|nr:hypothetical protein BJ166DRAFT_620285 [Pestalotiopsis sp. NC0098]